jgi:methylase of polypeptide subunit release factors
VIVPFIQQYQTALRDLSRCVAERNRMTGADGGQRFSQQLLNRLLLLRLIEARGWLEFHGRRDYLVALSATGSIYETRLKPLFLHLSGTAPQPAERIGTAPVLGSGPFDEVDFGAMVQDVPDAALAPLIGPQGLFYEFDFAIDEAAPARDGNVIDPEMLGTLFEEQLAGRDALGAFYTPREVVTFMCREALRGVLTQTMHSSTADLARLIDDRDPSELSADAAREIRYSLNTLRLIDPACGSGAYLVGMLAELTALHEVLDRHIPADQRLSRSDHKLQIIRGNLFGIDLDPLACEIARCRLWLAVMAEAPAPLLFSDLKARIATADALLHRLPADFGTGTFDVVLANPPYVRHELIGAATKHALGRRFPGVSHGHADLYCYFFARGLELLRDGGMHVCISSSSWLDVGFGKKLQQHLLTHTRLLAIYESRIERQFSTADVNTVISMARKESHADNPTIRFVSLRAPLAQALRDPSARREVSVTRDELWNPGGTESPGSIADYRGGKWSGRYLHAPDSFTRLLAAPVRLVRLADLPFCTLGRGRRTGWDPFFCLSPKQIDNLQIESQFLRPLVKSPTEFRRCPPRTSLLEFGRRLFVCSADQADLAGTGALRHIAAGELRKLHLGSVTPTAGRWYDVGRQPIADLILPIAFDERFFVVENDTRAEVHQRFATLVFGPSEKQFVPVIAALLSSSLVPLQAEVLGRHNLGQGALDFPPDDWREVMIPDPASLSDRTIAALTDAWGEIAAKVPLPFSQAARDPAFLRLDGVVARALNCDESLMAEIRREALELIESRLAKARRIASRSALEKI